MKVEFLLNDKEDLLLQVRKFDFDGYIKSNYGKPLKAHNSQVWIKDGKPCLCFDVSLDLDLEGWINLIENDIAGNGFISKDTQNELNDAELEMCTGISKALRDKYPIPSEVMISSLTKTPPEDIVRAYKEYLQVIKPEAVQEKCRIFFSLWNDWTFARKECSEMAFCHEYNESGHTGFRFFYNILDTTALSNRDTKRLYLSVGSIDGIKETIVIPENDDMLEELRNGKVSHTDLIREHISKPPIKYIQKTEPVKKRKSLFERE